MTVYDENAGSLLPFRLQKLERFQEKTEEWRREVDKDRDAFDNMREDFIRLTKAVDGLRRTLLGFAFSIALASIVFAFSVMVATGKVG